jgi:hypothetical protein
MKFIAGERNLFYRYVAGSGRALSTYSAVLPIIGLSIEKENCRCAYL